MTRSLLLSVLRPVSHGATGPEDAARSAPPIIRPTVPEICCTPERRLPRRSRRPRSAPGQTGPSTRRAPLTRRRERDRSLCHRRLYYCALLTGDGARVRLIGAIVEGS